MIERTFTVIEALTLALWIGALAGFAFIFAPTAFHIVVNLDQFALLTATVLERLTWLAFICGGLAIVAAIVRARDEAERPLAVIRVLLLIVMLALAWIESAAVIPHMQAVASSFGTSLNAIPKTDPRMLRYDGLHRQSSLIYGALFLLGLVTIALSALARPSARPRVWSR
jgi:hypothetical protein